MKRFLTILIFIAVVLPFTSYAQVTSPYDVMLAVRYERVGRGDSIMNIYLKPIIRFARERDMRRYDRLVRDLKKVYPIALEANATLIAMEAHLSTLKTKRERQAYTKSVEKMLKIKYTPVLRRMTFSQGKILIKLIDRETSRTSYELVKEFRGTFSAFFWQSVARLFGANLKDQYDREGEDRLIEELIKMYEAGLL